MAVKKNIKWYQNPVKLQWIFIGISSFVLLLELFNMYEIRQIRNDLFHYYLWP
jgi:hypothetical protein